MESISLQQKEIAKDLLEQIRGAIDNLLEWNKEYSEADDLLKSPGGMKTLAANCMLIEAIGESVKKLTQRPTDCYYANVRKSLGTILKE